MRLTDKALISPARSMLSSHGLPKGLDDRLTRIEALRLRARREAGGRILSLTDERSNGRKRMEFRFLCLLQTRRDAGGSGQGANITMQKAQKLRSLVEFQRMANQKKALVLSNHMKPRFEEETHEQS
ncbi:MAG: hypothetical protein ACLUI3_08825 [Christensenellales bacterium]